MTRHWRWVTIIAWLILCAWFLYNKWNDVLFFNLRDTDDNMRMSQVRALLHGQDWFDLRQYRLNPPFGADIHWSRLVDLPPAGLILLFQPFVGGADAERIAIAAAPMLPLLVLLFGSALTVRRLIDPRFYPIAFVVLFSAGSASGMFMPTRLDHHGWQLALLSIAVAGLADPKRARGGATVGVATALSLSIGLELLIYLALAGAATVLFWIDDRDERRRLWAYATSLSGGTALGFLLFASYANRQPVCDALSPVWLSDAMLGGALLFGLALLSPVKWQTRLALAAGAGLIVAGFHAFAWPHCLSRLEGVSPEVEQLWLSHVREARPIYRHPWPVMISMLAIPLTGIIGWCLLFWRNSRDRALLRRTIAVAAPAFVATALLLWQTRTGPAAQALNLAGAAGLIWVMVPIAAKWREPLRTAAIILVIVVGIGTAVPTALDLVPPKKLTPREIAINRANRLCNSLWALKPIAQLPKGRVFTFVDLGPRLITATHHESVIGPYHRNGEQIADVMNAFRGDADQARRIIRKYRSDYLLTCPGSSTTTIFMAEAPKGFYGQLQREQVPDWLAPIPMPEKSPFRVWRVVR